jgi:mRNA interferase HicA
VKGVEFMRKIRRAGRKRGVDVFFAARRGKGSHGILYFGERYTVVQDLKRELPSGTVHAMLEQLGLSQKDLT